MGGATGEQSLCACYKEHQEFQKVIELKDSGLVVYCRTTTTSKQDDQPGEPIGITKSAAHDVFILHNTKDDKITASDLKPSLEKKDISCPRCRRIFEHAQKLLQEVKLIDRKYIMGVCDHCVKKAQSLKKPCYECEQIAKKFISTRDKQKEHTKRCIKLWLSKMSDFLKDAVKSEKKLKTRAYSDLQIDRLNQYSPISRREPEVKPMFYPEIRKSDMNLYIETEDTYLAETLEKSVGFSKAVESVDTPYATYGAGKIDTVTASPGRVESDETFVEPHRDAKGPQRTSLRDPQDHRKKQEQLSEYYDDLTMDVKESIKKRHDLSLRQIMRTEKNIRTPFRPEISEIPKIAPWETISKHSDDSRIDATIATKTKHDLNSREIESRIDVEQRKKYKSSRKINLKPERELKSKKSVTKASQKDLSESPQKIHHIKSSDKIVKSVLDGKEATKRKFDLDLKQIMGFETDTQDPFEQHRGIKYARGKLSKGIYSSEEIPKKIKKLVPHITDEELKYQRSVPTLSHETEQQGQRMVKTKIKGKKPIDSEKSPEYVIRKQFSYFFPKTMETKENILDASSSQLIKNTQERLRLRAEEEKKRREEERKYQLEEMEKKKLAREEKKRFAEEKKKQQIYVEDQKNLPEVINSQIISQNVEKDPLGRMISEEENRHYLLKDDKSIKDKDKTDSMLAYKTKESEESKKGLKIKSELKENDDLILGKGTKDIKLKSKLIDKIEEVADKTKSLKSEQRDKIDEKSGKTKRELKSKPEQRDKNDDLLEKPKKELKSKQEQRDKTDDILEKPRKELKPKLEQRNKNDDVLEKQKKEVKSKAEQRNKIDDVLEIQKKDLKSKTEQRDKIDDVLEKQKKDMKIKPEQRHKIDDVLEKQKKELKSNTEQRDKIDDALEKQKKELKSKTEQRDKIDDVLEKQKKELKSKTEQIDKVDDVLEKQKNELKSKTEQRDKNDDVLKKQKKELRSKTEQSDKIDDVLEKQKKELKSKTEQRDKIDDVLEKQKKELKSKTEQRDKIDDVLEKQKKELKSKTEQRDKIDDASEKINKDKAKSEQRGKIDEVSEKTKREKSQSEPRDITEELSEKTKKDLKSKSGHKDQVEAVLEKSKKELKSKSEQRDEIHDVSEKSKKGKSKVESQEKNDDITEKSRKALTREEVSDKPKKDLKLKHEPKEESDDIKERSKKDLKSKSELRDKVDEVSEKAKKELKSQSDKKDTAKDITDKAKDLKSRPEPTHKVDTEIEKHQKAKIKSTDKEVENSQKVMSKEERNEQLKRENQNKDKMAQVEQSRKERQSDSQKKEDAKETEEPKKKIETSREKKASKKSEELSKENVEPLKKVELGKKLKKQSVDTVAPLKTKEWTSKELEQFAKKQQEMEKEEISKRKISKDLAETIKKKLDSIKEIEAPSKGKEISIPKKEKPAKVKEESKEVPGKVVDVPKKAIDGMDEAQYRKFQAEIAKQKEEDLKKKMLLEIEAQKLRDLADKRIKEEADRKSTLTREAKAVMKPEPERPASLSPKEAEEPLIEFKVQNIKIRNTSSDDLILRLVRIKQTAKRRTIKPRPCDIDPEVVKAHKCHHKNGQTSSLCELCYDSELEIDVESYENKKKLKKEMTEIIIGENIFKQKPSNFEKPEQLEVIPILFQSIFQEEPSPPREILQTAPPEAETLNTVIPNILQSKNSKGMEPEPAKGIIRYALSDRTFIDKGWTMLPTEKVVRKMNVYRMRPAHPEFDWFEHNKNKRVMNYDSGEKLAEFDDNGRGRWYYRSGRLALDYYDAEETNAQQRFVIYSSGEPDERGRTHPITILATFDYLGNGIVFDHAGKIRLKYNQTEGVVLDRGIGPVSHWKWHTLNDPPVLQQVMIDTQMAHKDPKIIKLGTSADTKIRPDNEEMLAIEFDNFIKEKSKKLSQKFKPFQIKMKALKINEHFSLKVLDQATIYLIFRDGSTNLKLNIGMILDHQEIVDTDTAEVGEVSNSLERFPARTDSLAGLQRSVAYAQRYERQRTERERRLRHPEPCASADQLNAAASPPLRLPLRTMPAGSTSSAGCCNCRKPANNLYYNTRLL